MKKLKNILFAFLTAFLTITSVAQKISITANYSLRDFYVDRNDSAHFIKYFLNNSVRYFPEAGYAGLPFITCHVLLPHNAKITRILMAGGRSEICRDTFLIRPIAASSAHDYIRFENPELYAGYQINGIYICPFRYAAESKELLFYSQLNLDIFYQAEPIPVILEQSAEKIKLGREFIRMKVINPEDADTIIPLEDKLDYSGLDFFKYETDSLDPEIKETPKLKSSSEPFYIKRIR